MKVYVLMIKDRHTDPDAEVFTTLAKAGAAAEAYLVGIPDVEVDESPPGGWLFCARYSVEGDRVWVIEKELR